MGYFPMCVNLAGRRVFLVGDGPQIREKAERLAPFGAQLVHLKALTPQDLADKPVFVIAGDLDAQEAERTAALCAAHGVMINVVDQPRLCTFAFPSLIARGDLTVSVSTAGKAPGAAAYLRECIGRQLP
ncbi:MAG: NAD(P)-dependent oxidoreductase, partial [Eubacteriales bacterium]|nr:NAD(P)-dependent oxidoreductase [Eubacteriales bacterium]